MKSSSNHIVWLDWARAAAILTVILCHSVEAIYSFTVQDVGNTPFLPKFVEFSLFTIGRLGVPIFLFMTGFLLLDREYSKDDIKVFWRTKWLGIVIATEIWVVVYNIFLCVVDQKSFDIIFLIKNMLFLEKVGMGHVWYMPMIIGLYLFLPFIANGLAKLKDPHILIFPLCVMGLILFGTPIVSTLFQSFGMSALSSEIAAGFSGGVYGVYMFFGYLVKRNLFKADRVLTSYLLVLGIVTFVLVVLLQIYAFGCAVAYTVWYSNGLLLISGLCLFLLISRAPLRKERFTVSFLAKYSFALYLVHFPIKILLTPYIVGLGIQSRPLEVLLLSVVVLLASLLCCVVIAHIPKLGKRILYMRS